MARSKKSSSKSRYKRESMDWVVNEDTYGDITSVGNAMLVAIPLTVPQMQIDYSTVALGVSAYQGSAFPEANQRLFVKAVVGQFHVLPSVWGIAAAYTAMFRIMSKVTDYVTGNAIADATYSLIDPNFANERFMWQKWVANRQDLGTAPEVHTVRATINRYLEPDEGLFFMCHNVTGVTQNLSIRPFLRTLVRT